MKQGISRPIPTLASKRIRLQASNADGAPQIIEAKTQSERQPGLNLPIAKAYPAGTTFA